VLHLLCYPLTPRVIAHQGVVIDISWSDNKLRKSCASDKQGLKKFGADHWKLLRRRLESLLAAPTLKDMDGVPGRCHPLKADRRGQFAVCLWGSYRLIFVPDHDPIPTLADGGIDPQQVTQILIEEVTDYHGN
jgi:toxin HigB-1